MFFDRDVGNQTIEGRIGAAFARSNLFTVFNGSIKLLLLGIQFGESAEEFQVLRFFREPLFVFPNEAFGDVLALDLAILLFESFGLAFVFQDVAIGAGAVG